MKRDEGRRWPRKQASRLWLLSIPCWKRRRNGGAELSIGSWEAGECVSHYVFNPGHIPDISCILSYIAKLPLLQRRPGVGAAAKHVGEGAVICPQLKLPALYLETEMPDGAESRQQFPVKRAVGYLSTVQLLGEETQRLLGVAGASALMEGCPYVT